ncbi:histidine kinase [Burkholderia multivorans]|nr:histidine kinase [Burkholderia multivorans]KWH23224.1 histidine kinase [Burkholderia multivorans]PRE71624.1 histidine kinase [Burkholderia multivorans]PRF12702.1 histidine kinase [Burkholderia multivorans]
MQSESEAGCAMRAPQYAHLNVRAARRRGCRATHAYDRERCARHRACAPPDPLGQRSGRIRAPIR